MCMCRLIVTHILFTTVLCLLFSVSILFLTPNPLHLMINESFYVFFCLLLSRFLLKTFCFSFFFGLPKTKVLKLFFANIYFFSSSSLDDIQQAVIEKFALCEENVTQLLKWISEIENKIASVGGPRERIDELRNQINLLKVRIF